MRLRSRDRDEREEFKNRTLNTEGCGTRGLSVCCATNGGWFVGGRRSVVRMASRPRGSLKFKNIGAAIGALFFAHAAAHAEDADALLVFA